MHKIAIKTKSKDINKTIIEESGISFTYSVEDIKKQIEDHKLKVEKYTQDEKLAKKLLDNTHNNKHTAFLEKMSIEQVETMFIAYIRARKMLLELPKVLKHLKSTTETYKPINKFLETELNIKFK